MSQPAMVTEQQVNLEYALYDVLDDICRCLDIKSLRHVALVSRLWSQAAMRELSKRRPGPLCRVLLPVLYAGAPPFIWEKHFSEEPDTLLMFCGPRAQARRVLDLEFKVMGTFFKRIPGRMIILGVDEIVVNVDGRVEEIQSCKEMGHRYQAERVVHNDCSVGLSLPKCEGFKIEVVDCVSHEEPAQTLAEEVFQKLNDVVEGVENPIFLLFSRNGYSIGQRFMKMFREKYADKPVSLWGGTIANHIKRSDSGYPDYRGTHGFLALVLHGPRLRAYCAVVPNDNKDNITKRLADFRASLRLRRRSVGLVCGPQITEIEKCDAWTLRKDDAMDKMEMVVREMKGIQFTGMFNDQDFYYYGCDRGNESKDYTLEHKNAYSIMVLTYD